MTTATEQNTTEPRQQNLWKRALYMVFFAIVMRIVELVLGLVMIAQFIAKLATGKAIDSLLDVGASLSRYVSQVVQFQTFVTDDKPYPFGNWPKTSSPTRTVEPEVLPPETGEGGSPNPA